MRLIDDPKKFVGETVHVCGWDQRAVFKLIESNGVVHKLRTTFRKKEYETTNDLRMTRRTQLKYEGSTQNTAKA